MDDISAEIGASETLNLYRDLVLQLRKWISSYPENCLTLCEETFLPNISSRYHTIDKQLAMSNYNKHWYYNQLNFPYYQSSGESFCYSYCARYNYFQLSAPASALLLVSVAVTLDFMYIILKKIYTHKQNQAGDKLSDFDQLLVNPDLYNRSLLSESEQTQESEQKADKDWRNLADCRGSEPTRDISSLMGMDLCNLYYNYGTALYIQYLGWIA